MQEEAEKLPRKVAIVCNYHVWCNGVGDCEKCPFLLELKIEDLDALEKEAPVAEEGCNCG
jgi:hypothetical protein